MRNWFYRMQMKAGSNGERIAENMLQQRLITADIDYAGEQFNHLQQGDIILIHKGAFPISLVKIKYKVDEDKLSSGSFGIDYSIEVLSEYDKLTTEEQNAIDLWGNAPPTGTFFKINSGNNTFNRINTWYKIITNKKEMSNLLDLIDYKKQIILQGPPGTGKTYTAKDIAEQLIYGQVSIDKDEQKKQLESTDQFKLIQFHPAYSYEDFVRGIVAESKGEAIEYKTKDKLLAAFANIANTNFTNSQKVATVYSKEKWIDEKFQAFLEQIQDRLEAESKIELTDKVSIFDTEPDAFRYKGQDGWNKNGNRMLFSDIKRAFFDDNKERQDIKKNENLSGLAFHHASYYIRVLNLFKDYLKKNNEVYKENPIPVEPLKPYVLIVDEINRANLPAVLGELIYALEYRGENVDSMYAVELGGNKIVIPKNLYIIGTMNTSDRSVGHIDYAIRRRFAFVDVLPKVLEGDNFELELFKQVSALFIKNLNEYIADDTVKLIPSEHLSDEFAPEAVWLGHSYFIKGKGDFALRKKYEIIPILKEYVKDGILKKSAEDEIEKLK